MPFTNQLQSPIVKLTKVIRGIEKIIPLETQPSDVSLNRVDVLLAFFARIGVIETQIAFATVSFCQTKVQANALGMSDVKIAIGLGRKTGLNLLTLQGLLGRKVLFDFVLNEVLVVWVRFLVIRGMGHDG